MAASAQVRDPAFASRVVAETRALLATVPMDGSPAKERLQALPAGSGGQESGCFQ